MAELPVVLVASGLCKVPALVLPGVAELFCDPESRLLTPRSVADKLPSFRSFICSVCLPALPVVEPGWEMV